MKLIASLTSPYARKVRIVLAEKKIDCPIEIDIPWDAGTNVPNYNPLGKVPVLELDDGMIFVNNNAHFSKCQKV